MTNSNLPTNRGNSQPTSSHMSSTSFVQKIGPSALVLSVTGLSIMAASFTVMSSFAVLALGAAASFAGAGLGLVRYIQGGHYIENHSPTKSAQHFELKQLKRAISKLRYEEGFAREEFIEACVEHIEAFDKQYQLYLTQLKAKFEPGELTYGRYLQAGENLYLALTSSFLELQQVLEQIAVFNEDKLRKQQKKAEKAGEKFEEPRLTKLNGLWERATGLDQLIVEAMSSLQHTTDEISKVVTDSTVQKKDLEDIMLQLKTLADRAHKYSAK